MKTLLTLVMVAFALSAKAGNEGAQATPQPLTKVLAEYVEHGGFFVPPGQPASKSYQILSDGTVQVETWYRGNKKPVTRVLKKLSASKLAQLNDLVQSIEPGDVVDPDPSSPGCQDAGGFKYSVNTDDGEIVILENFNCKNRTRPNASAADKAMIETLNSVKKLANKK